MALLSSSDSLIHPQDGVPRAHALAVVTTAWSRRRTGILLGPFAHSVLVRGEPASRAGLEHVVRALYSGVLVFREQARTEQRGLDRLAPHLYEAAWRLAQPLPTVPDLLLAEAPGSLAARRLPLTTGTLALLRRRDEGTHDLGRLISGVHVDHDRVARDLRVVLALGLYRVQAAQPRLEVEPSSTEPPPMRRETLLVRRLQRDWDAIHDADDWTVVGATPMMDEISITRACGRMRERYRPLVDDPRVPPEGRELANRIHRRVMQAIERIRPAADETSG